MEANFIVYGLKIMYNSNSLVYELDTINFYKEDELIWIDIGKTNCTKKNAINILAEKLGIKQEEIIVMGDGRKRLINVWKCGFKNSNGKCRRIFKRKSRLYNYK